MQEKTQNAMAKEKEFLAAYDKYAAGILKHIYFRVNNWTLAEDLTQETFFKTWNYLACGSGNIKNFKTFLYRVAHNLIVDHYRRKAKIPLSLEAINAEEIPDNCTQEETTNLLINKELVKECVKELDDVSRRIIIYRYVDDLEIGEISELTNKTENNISVIIHRAIKILKGKINGKICLTKQI